MNRKYIALPVALVLLAPAYVLPKNPLKSSPDIENAVVIQKAMRQIYKEVNPAVVRIETEATVRMQHPLFNDPMFRRFFGVPNQQQKQQGLGSGFIISASGFIVTNHHVIGRPGKRRYVDKVRVRLVNGRSYNAKIVGSDPQSDLAVLKIKAKGKLKFVHLGNSDSIEVGDFAIAIGNPFGLSSTFTMGIISSKGQDIESRDGVPRIQTDAAINPGNSGGPLLNIYGEVIGINQMIYSQSGGSVGIGFAIPINYAMTIIEKLKKGKKIRHGYIGISVITSPNPEQLRSLKLKGKTGLLIGQVVLGSPAWKAGLRPYDFIMTIDGKPARKFSRLKAAIIRRGVGRKLRLTVVRNGARREFTVKIGQARG